MTRPPAHGRAAASATRHGGPAGALASTMTQGAPPGAPRSFWLWSGSSSALAAPAQPRESAAVVLAVCAALLGPALFGIALGYTSPCLTPLAADMGLTTLQASTFASVINLGAVCSGLFGMRYVETLGRKTCLIVTGALYAAGFGAIATCGSYPELLVARFVTGLGAGLATVVTPCYIAEISPAARRGALGSLYQLFCTLGILAAYGLGGVFHWRYLASLTAGLSMVLVVVCQMLLPETSAWLDKSGRTDEAGAWRRGLALAESSPAPDTPTAAPDGGAGGGMSKAALRRALLLVGGMMVLQQLSGINCILFFSGEILAKAGLGQDVSACLLQTSAPAICR